MTRITPLICLLSLYAACAYADANKPAPQTVQVWTWDRDDSLIELKGLSAKTQSASFPKIDLLGFQQKPSQSLSGEKLPPFPSPDVIKTTIPHTEATLEAAQTQGQSGLVELAFRYPQFEGFIDYNELNSKELPILPVTSEYEFSGTVRLTDKQPTLLGEITEKVGRYDEEHILREYISPIPFFAQTTETQATAPATPPARYRISATWEGKEKYDFKRISLVLEPGTHSQLAEVSITPYFKAHPEPGISTISMLRFPTELKAELVEHEDKSVTATFSWQYSRQMEVTQGLSWKLNDTFTTNVEQLTLTGKFETRSDQTCHVEWSMSNGKESFPMKETPTIEISRIQSDVKNPLPCKSDEKMQGVFTLSLERYSPKTQ